MSTAETRARLRRGAPAQSLRRPTPHRRGGRHPLARDVRRRGLLRDPRRGDPADLRRARLDRHRDQARARAPRAGRRPHGPGLRAGHRQGRRGHGHLGPGATNLVTPVADAFLDSTPLVIVTGQVPSHLIGTDAFQEADTTGIFLPIVKHSYLVTKVDDIPRVVHGGLPPGLDRAARARCWSTSRRTSPTPRSRSAGPSSSTCRATGRPRKGHPLQIQEAALAIARARKPVLYVGGGVINAGAETELKELAEADPHPRRHDADGQGRVPRLARALAADARHARLQYANWALHHADLLITVGARFDDRVTGKLDAFAPGAKVIHMRHRPGRDLEEPQGRRADRRRAAPDPAALTKAMQARESEAMQDRTPSGAPSSRAGACKYPFRYRRGARSSRST